MRKEKSKTPMTLEDLASAIQRELGRMATKDDLTGLATKGDIAGLRSEMSEKFGDIAVRIENVRDDLQGQIAGLKYAKEIDHLRARVDVLEHKVGIKHVTG